MKVALVGGSGFIGTALSRHLAGTPVRQTSLDLVPPSLPGVAWARCDIREDGLGGASLDSYDAVVHLAGLLGRVCGDDPEGGWLTNVVGTRNLLEAIKRSGTIKRVLFLSTSMVYAEPCHLANSPAARACGQCIYRESKLRGEAMLSEAAGQEGLDVTTLRPFSVYGPGPAEGRRGHFIASWIERAEVGLPLPLYGTGEQTVDLLHVDDLARLCLAVLMSNPTQAGTVTTADAGTGEPVSVSRIAGWFTQVRPELKIDRYPDRTISDRPAADTRTARRLFGWEAATHADEGVPALLRQRLACPG